MSEEGGEAGEPVVEARAKELLKHFGSLRKIKEADVAEIAQVKGFSASLAARVKEALGEA